MGRSATRRLAVDCQAFSDPNTAPYEAGEKPAQCTLLHINTMTKGGEPYSSRRLTILDGGTINFCTLYLHATHFTSAADSHSFAR